ncbi:MAG TPA: diguanylate cyclase [Solirubrobacteraceae bacterium]|nr:diguanylate cyclase [Solirubrobacteraceae bacterium]
MRAVHVVLAHADPAVRSRLIRVLTRVGHEVRAVETAQEALDGCREQPPDVVLVDVELCHHEEDALLAALKRDPNAYRSAVVLLERHDLDLDAAVAALHRGVQDFLVEPFSDAELVTRVDAAGRTKVLQEELVGQSERLEAMLFEDPLTGLSNRRFILTQLGGAVSAARRHERTLSVAIVDIDHFKAVNDEHGHAAGDRVLAAVAGAMREHLRAEDQLGRLGGEEFLALLPDADARAAAATAEKLRSETAALTVVHEGVDLGVTISAGWAAWEGESPEQLLRRADEALYEAKRSGRDRVAGAPATVQRRT